MAIPASGAGRGGNLASRMANSPAVFVVSDVALMSLPFPFVPLVLLVSLPFAPVSFPSISTFALEAPARMLSLTVERGVVAVALLERKSLQRSFRGSNLSRWCRSRGPEGVHQGKIGLGGEPMGMFGNWYQMSRIREAETTASEARDGVQEQGLTVRELERQVQRLTIVVTALAEILRDRHGTPVEVIEAKIQEVENREAPSHPRAKRCSGCGRLSSPDHTNCMYCNEPLASEPFLLGKEQGTAQEKRIGSERDGHASN